ncbi:MAG TPA: complex I NDUFA9 subunit family protein [Stellaceae bacterium]|jgi:NADH dehydrogenase
MRYRRVAITGASGFIGRYVVKRLAARGAVVAALVRNVDRANFLRTMGDVGQIALVRAGLDEEGVLAAALTECDSVVSLAGILHEGGGAGQRFDKVHRDGPALLARLAQAAGVRHFVHVSAIGADPASPSAYARSKGEGEAAVRAAFPGAVILRPSVVFGPEDQFFNRFAAMAQVAPALPLVGGGATRFQPVYVGDVADAVVKALAEPAAAGKTYELGGPETYTFRELMELMLATVNRKRRLVTLPFGTASFLGSIMEKLPNPALTRDQVTLLRHDNVVSPGAMTLADLGIAPTAVEVILPSYMDRFRRGGWFASHGMARDQRLAQQRSDPVPLASTTDQVIGLKKQQEHAETRR